MKEIAIVEHRQFTTLAIDGYCYSIHFAKIKKNNGRTYVFERIFYFFWKK